MNIHAECNRLTNEFRVKLAEVEDAIAKAKREGLKIPSSLEDKLHDTRCRYLDVEKGVIYGEEEEAIKEIPKLIELMDQVHSDVLKLYLAEPYQKACATRKFFEGYEDLASDRIPNYSEHNENFSKIKKLMESDEKLSEFQIGTYSDQLKNFVNDFESVKEVLSLGINRKKIAKVISCITVAFAVLGAAVSSAGLVVGIIGIKGCSDSSQQPAQSETELQSAENNSTLNP